MSQRHPIQNEVIMLVTSVTVGRETFFEDAAYAREACETLYRVQELHPFFLYAFVVMPDHCHFLLRVAPPETISHIMNVYKSGLTFNLGIKKIWQKGFDIRIVKNPEEARRYIHLNPVKGGLVEIAEDYPWSSASGKWDTTHFEFFI